MRIEIDISDEDIKRVDRYREFMWSQDADWSRVLRRLGFTTSEALYNLVREGLWRHETRLREYAEGVPMELPELPEPVTPPVVPAWLAQLQTEQES